jgi:hypothetical protein
LQLDIPQTTLWETVYNRLHLHAYKVQILHALKPANEHRRFQFAKDMLPNIEAVKIAFGYAHSVMNQHFAYHTSSLQNMEIRKSSYHLRNLKVNVWCAMPCAMTDVHVEVV